VPDEAGGATILRFCRNEPIAVKRAIVALEVFLDPVQVALGYQVALYQDEEVPDNHANYE
jgi:hypothetical protein